MRPNEDGSNGQIWADERDENMTLRNFGEREKKTGRRYDRRGEEEMRGWT